MINDTDNIAVLSAAGGMEQLLFAQIDIRIRGALVQIL